METLGCRVQHWDSADGDLLAVVRTISIRRSPSHLLAIPDTGLRSGDSHRIETTRLRHLRSHPRARSHARHRVRTPLIDAAAILPASPTSGFCGRS